MNLPAGLHFDDVAKLVRVLKRLVEMNVMVVLLASTLTAVKNADHIMNPHRT